MSSLVAQDVGRYHIVDQLGEGGMAVVYKAYDTRLECTVAIKFIRTERLIPEMADLALQRFKREVRMLAHLNHANIVRVSDYGEFEDRPYLVMPYYAGGTLKQKLGQPLAWEEAAHTLLPVSKALEYAHKQGIIHRDVKPSNILITDSGEPMLTDFGVAKILDQQQDQLELTGTNMTVGSPEYMAPEQVTSKTVDHRADIYALGIVFYEMVAGRKPFIADTPMAVLLKHASEPLPRPREFVHNLPEEVENVLFKSLAKDPGGRYSSMQELTQAFEQLLNGNLNLVRSSQPVSKTNNAASQANTYQVQSSLEDESGIHLDLDEVSTQTNIKGQNKTPGINVLGPCLLSLNGDVYEIRGDEIFIGRRDERRGITNIDVDLSKMDSEMSVSRKHARIFCSRGVYRITDLDSTNGTFLNDQELKPNTTHPLKDGDRLRFGDIGMIFSLKTDS